MGGSRRAGQRSVWAGEMRGRLYSGSDLGWVARLRGVWDDGGGDWELAGASVLGRLAVGTLAGGWAEVMVRAGVAKVGGRSEAVAEVWAEGWVEVEGWASAWVEGWADAQCLAEVWAWRFGSSEPEDWAKGMVGLRAWPHWRCWAVVRGLGAGDWAEGGAECWGCGLGCETSWAARGLGVAGWAEGGAELGLGCALEVRVAVGRYLGW